MSLEEELESCFHYENNVNELVDWIIDRRDSIQGAVFICKDQEGLVWVCYDRKLGVPESYLLLEKAKDIMLNEPDVVDEE